MNETSRKTAVAVFFGIVGVVVGVVVSGGLTVGTPLMGGLIGAAAGFLLASS